MEQESHDQERRGPVRIDQVRREVSLALDRLADIADRLERQPHSRGSDTRTARLRNQLEGELARAADALSRGAYDAQRHLRHASQESLRILDDHGGQAPNS